MSSNLRQTAETLSSDEVTFVVDSCPEGGFTARAVGFSVFTEGETLESLQEAVRSAVACHFGDGVIPASIRLLVGGEQVVIEP
jgi:hypothetical protein